jgi:hypothetical protein
MCDGFRIPYFVVVNEIYKVALVKSSTLMENNIYVFNQSFLSYLHTKT